MQEKHFLKNFPSLKNRDWYLGKDPTRWYMDIVIQEYCLDKKRVLEAIEKLENPFNQALSHYSELLIETLLNKNPELQEQIKIMSIKYKRTYIKVEELKKELGLK